jgi:two-component system sensor histidine kinase HydH
MKRKKFGKPRFLVLFFIVLAGIMIFSALFELYQSKHEIYTLMEDQSHSLLESLIMSSYNSLTFNEYLEKAYERRLLNNARLVKILFDKGQVSNQILSDIGQQNQIFRINIYNQYGTKIFSSHRQEHFDQPERYSPIDVLQPIFRGTKDSLVIGIKQARYESGYRYAVAIAAKNRSAIVVNVNAEQILKLRREMGFGVSLRKMIQNPGIIYAALQDTSTIIAASGNIRQLEKINSSEFLNRSLVDSLFLTRTIIFDSLEVFEAVHPFEYQGSTIGLFRLGISLDPVKDINSRIYRRLAIITIVLILVGSLLFTFIFIRQRYDLLQTQYQDVETYSSNILHNVSDSIIVFDYNHGIKIFNSAAEKLFHLTEKTVLGWPVSKVFDTADLDKIMKTKATMHQIECKIGGEIKYLLISKTNLSDSNNLNNTIMVLRDLTEQKNMEIQIQRKHRLSAMGELASGVAHEIRNPLNTIGTIVQQINKDFEPSRNRQEYHQLVGLVYQEVKRIDKTIGDFLRFARPEPIKPELFNFKQFLNEITKQYQHLLETHQIKLKIKTEWEGSVYWDRQQIKQVLMNLMQNAIDAIKQDGRVELSTVLTSKDKLQIIFSDNGPGMREEIRSQIFNLYFTTKAKGTGIGLSMVQRIVYAHGGTINVDSNPGDGTRFILHLPLKIKKI